MPTDDAEAVGQVLGRGVLLDPHLGGPFAVLLLKLGAGRGAVERLVVDVLVPAQPVDSAVSHEEPVGASRIASRYIRTGP